MLVDLHLHTRFSFDSREAMENYIEKAKECGASTLGFSEHYDYDAYVDGADIPETDIAAYTAYLDGLKQRSGNVKLLKGIEFGYRDFAVDEYKKLIDKFDFDYIINSVHTLPNRGDCFHDGFFRGKTLRENYFDYFEAVLESVKADYDFQIIGHIGYVSRYRTESGATIHYKDFSDILDEILKEIIARDKCLEINSSTGKSGSQFLPDCDVVDRYLELGGEKLSFGSDAHSVSAFLNKGAKLKDYLNRRGVKRLFYYEKRKPVTYLV